MCWTSRNKPVKRTADEDISVFKIMEINEEELSAFYQDFKYEKGKSYNTKIEIVKSYNTVIKIFEDLMFERVLYTITEGFHSYSSKYISKIGEFSDMRVLYIFRRINGKFQSIDGLHLLNNTIYAKVNCIIPKGSKYYIDDKGEYVSNQIKVIDYYVLDK